MAKTISKLTARGKRQGVATVVECIEYEDAGETKVKILKDGKPDDDLSLELESYVFDLSIASSGAAWLPNYSLFTISGYWVALHEIYFDEPPTIEIAGKFKPLGLPYSNDDTTGIVF